MVVEPFGQHQNRPRRLVGKLEIFRSRLEGEARDLLAPIYGWFTEGFDRFALSFSAFDPNPDISFPRTRRCASHPSSAWPITRSPALQRRRRIGSRKNSAKQNCSSKRTVRFH
jgi:hypothetical protein